MSLKLQALFAGTHYSATAVPFHRYSRYPFTDIFKILHQLMEEVAEAARESSRNARAELDRRMEEVRKSAKEKRIAREKGDH